MGTLERAIMEALWRQPGGLFAQDLAERLESRPATTTVLTVLVRLTKKGMVSRRRIGRAHLYEAAVAKDAVVAEAMRAALEEAGDVALAVQRFVGVVPPEVATALRDALEARDD
ncbi:BlaI/MecI/CopY family transcriptional regulator [Herbidospora cretacea]|uniref:BlaI/MecI/CopY family transcriptional regulator n=1 Tax=Herbidospora cretacea TaxID=28444 RepID=UPI0004C3E97A|nr:BlaI/MecI/CopY family transcriptional regulator [Herbidospora cretacea]